MIDSATFWRNVVADLLRGNRHYLLRVLIPFPLWLFCRHGAGHYGFFQLL